MQVQDLNRLQQIARVLAKNGFGHALGLIGVTGALPAASPEVASRPFARRLRQALIDLGPTWVKLGQVLSVRPDILPPDVLAEFQSLQDRVPPMSEEDARQVIREELGLPLEDVFSEFDLAPLGSASIAQVHRAVLAETGEEVAVKLQRPGIDAKIRSDLHILYTLAATLEGRFVLPGMYQPVAIIREFDQAITRELDFTQELQSAERFHRNFRDSDDIIVPSVYPRWSTRRLMVMELVRGEPLSTRMKGATKVTEESRALAHLLMECAYQQVFTHGFFHGDPHPGNLLVTEDNRIIVLDFGLTGLLTGAMQDTLISAFTSMVFRDAETLAMTVYRAGAVSDRVDIKEFKNEIERLMTKYYGMSLDEVSESPDTLIEVIQVATKYNIDLPPEFAVLSRTFGLIEGSIRALLPGVDIVEEVKPYAQRLMTNRFSPDRIALDVARAMVQLQGHFRELPTQLTQVMMDLEGGNLSFETRNPEVDDLRADITLGVLRLSLAMLASTISLGALLFLAAWSPQPFGLPLFGLLGLVLALLGAALFGALGVHVLFARFLNVRFWAVQARRVLRFFSWRRRR